MKSHSYHIIDPQDILFVVQIGFSAPQGCGKTTLVIALDYLFRITGRCVVD